jgi:predicted DNA-binding ribbon-helix-helix protein
MVVALMHNGCAVSHIAADSHGPASWRRYGYYVSARVIMKSHVAKRSVNVAGRKTSVSLEEAFWESMKEISRTRRLAVSDLVDEINSNRHEGNLSSAIRLFVLTYFKDRGAAGAGSELGGETADIKPASSGTVPHSRDANPA